MKTLLTVLPLVIAAGVVGCNSADRRPSVYPVIEPEPREETVRFSHCGDCGDSGCEEADVIR